MRRRLVMPDRRCYDIRWPAGLTAYACVLGTSAFASGVRGLPWWYQLLVALSALLLIACVWLTSLSDPGIIPPIAVRDPVIDALENGQQLQGYNQDAKGRWTRTALTPEGYRERETFCLTCNVWRRRGYHCDICGFCMERGDHHCGVMSNCIATYNHRWFAGMLCSGWVGCMLMTGGCVWRLKADAVWEQAESYILIVLAAIYGYHAVVFIFGLFHAAGILCDFTTKEVAGREADCGDHAPCFPGKRNPRALARAWRALCCTPVIWKPHPAACVPSQLQQQDAGIAGPVAWAVGPTAAVLRIQQL